MPTRRATLIGFILAALSGPEAALANSWTPIVGATGQHYTPRSGDQGHRLRCRIIAHNSAGSATMHTPQTNAVKGT